MVQDFFRPFSRNSSGFRRSAVTRCETGEVRGRDNRRLNYDSEARRAGIPSEESPELFEKDAPGRLVFHHEMIRARQRHVARTWNCRGQLAAPLRKHRVIVV